MALAHAETARHAQLIELAHQRFRCLRATAIGASRRAVARVSLVGEVVANIAFGIAGVGAAVAGVVADTDLCSRLDVTAAIARAGQARSRIATAAVRILFAQIATPDGPGAHRRLQQSPQPLHNMPSTLSQ